MVIGILGGGQLARLMALRAHDIGLKVSILSLNKDDPGAQVTQLWVQGDPNSVDDVSNFYKEVDVLTFESEFTSSQVLTYLKKSKRVFPSPSLMLKLRDRSSQKKLLLDHDIPTSPFSSLPNDEYLDLKTLSIPKVMKSVVDGYDGKGTFILTKNNIQHGRNFLKNSPGVIIEDFIPFKRELAVSISRSRDGSVAVFPLVETKQIDNRCLWVKGPVLHPNYPAFLKKIERFISSINYIGIMAFELFDTKDQLIVNEVAPRVHNSAHYSTNALIEDQFMSHIKAVTGQPLRRPQSQSQGFAMFNLIGSSKKKPTWKLDSDIFLHWYGKNKNRPGRKMGHINALGPNPEQALIKLKKAIKEFNL